MSTAHVGLLVQQSRSVSQRSGKLFFADPPLSRVRLWSYLFKNLPLQPHRIYAKVGEKSLGLGLGLCLAKAQALVGLGLGKRGLLLMPSSGLGSSKTENFCCGLLRIYFCNILRSMGDIEENVYLSTFFGVDAEKSRKINFFFKIAHTAQYVAEINSE